MACKMTIKLLSEHQEGTIGNDWRYRLEAKVFATGESQARIGQGAITVPKHRLDSGRTQAPPGPPEPLVLPAGEAGAQILVELRLKVAEVDVLMNDTGEATATLKLLCPAGGAAVVEERELSVGVLEEPSQVGKAIFKLAYRIALEND